MIRELSADDLLDIEEIFFNSFPIEEAPITFTVIKKLVSQSAKEGNYCIGYQLDEKIVGVVGFSPVFFAPDTGISAYLLSPLATHKLHQKKGIATQLIETAKAHFKANNVDALLVYGDPEYYARYGFDAILGKHFVPPYPLEYEFGWQATMLNDKVVTNATLHFTCVSALSDASLW